MTNQRIEEITARYEAVTPEQAGEFMKKAPINGALKNKKITGEISLLKIRR